MKILAVDDEKIALENLKRSIKKWYHKQKYMVSEILKRHLYSVQKTNVK